MPDAGKVLLRFRVVTVKARLELTCFEGGVYSLGQFKTKLRQRRKKRIGSTIWLVITGLGVILLIALVMMSGASRDQAEIQVRGAPGIYLDRDFFDFGDVTLGKEPVRVVVRVTNVGDQPLKFREPPYLEVLEGC
jgi:amino acid transporter